MLALFDRPADEADVRAIHRLVTLFALVAVRPPARVDALAEGVDAFQLRGLLTADGPLNDDARVRFARMGFDLSADQVVTVAALPPRSDPERVAGALRAGRPPSDPVLVVDDRLVTITAGEETKRAAEEVMGTARRRTGIALLVCASIVRDPLAGGLADAYRTADAALGLLQSLGRTSGAFDVDEFPSHLPLLRSVTVDSVVRFLDDTIGPVVEFDCQGSSELVRTMSVFFAENMNTAATARALDLHPNTIIKRLRRVTDLLGPRWQGDPDSLAIRIALNLHGLARGGADGGR
ncbi:PucR family transcriptional regulator [Tsukamurella sp. USMM236]|uniref:PucR family transcriptional regulator n=1 Tax=Tsukamurella sp. USMM236 TaxID=3081301 RepID=UPI0030168F52